MARRSLVGCARSTSACALLVALTASRWAFAGDPFADPYDLPDTPRAPTLPELTHNDVEVTAESTFGVVSAARSASGVERATSLTFVQRFSAELPVYERRWFLGANYVVTTGEPPFGGGDTKLVGGNLELYGRTVWASRTGLALGGGLGLVAPTAWFDDDSPASRVASAATSVRPWDHPMFLSGYVSLRPFIDVRAVDGRFVIQFRQGLDASLDLRDSRAGRLAAIAALYTGYSVGNVVGLGFEIFEYYFLRGPVADDRRANIFVSPSVRMLFHYVQPALSAYHSLGTPIDEPGAPVAPVWGVRLATTIVLGP